ncbi:MAG: hypothetical protein PHF56_11540 [Desulfuromonadaceae bacterium]|nr:hypothetical protein [Desulfuromonadaceae bacterium]
MKNIFVTSMVAMFVIISGIALSPSFSMAAECTAYMTSPTAGVSNGYLNITGYGVCSSQVAIRGYSITIDGVMGTTNSQCYPYAYNGGTRSDYTTSQVFAVGTHTVQFGINTTGGSFLSDPVTFTVERPATVKALGPVGRVQGADLVGQANSHNPSPMLWDGLLGNVCSYLDGVKQGCIACYRDYNCKVAFKGYRFSPGLHVVTFSIHPLADSTVYPTDSLGFVAEEYCEDLGDPNADPLGLLGPPPGGFTPVGTAPKVECEPRKQCPAKKEGDSSFNVVTGSLFQEIPLFETTGGAMPTAMTLYYDSGDQMNILPHTGYLKPYKFVLGQGWSHSYDINIYTNPLDQKRILRGAGLDKRFYTPNGTGFTSPSGDSSILTRAANGNYTLTFRDGLIYRFNTNGLLTAIVDRYNNTVTIDRSNPSQVVIIDPAGRRTTLHMDYYYNERIVFITAPDGKVYTLDYNSGTYLLEKITFPVPATGETAPVWTFGYNIFRLMQSKTSPEQQTVTYQFGDDHRLKQSTDPEGGTRKLTYGSTATMYTDKNNQNWWHDIDPQNRKVASSFSPQANGTLYTYQGNQSETVSKPVDQDISHAQETTYDSYGNAVLVTGRPVVNSLDENGNPVATPGPVDQQIAYTYDYAAFDRPLTITDVLAGTATNYVYDQDGGYQRTRVTSPTGGITTTRYLSNGFIKDLKTPGGSTVAYNYTTSGLLQSVTVASGARTDYGPFDAMGRPLTVKSYDAAATLRTTINFVYDTLGRLRTRTVLGSSGALYTSTFSYNKNGDLIRQVDANGQATGYAYNFKGKPTAITDALGKTTQMQYMGAEQLSSLQDANNNTTMFAYTQDGLLAKETPPVGVPIRYEYYPSGQVRQKVNDATNTVLISYTYDAMGRLLTRTAASGEVETFVYNAAGQPTSAASSNGSSYAYSYSATSLLQSVTDNAGRAINYTYDTAGRKTSMTVMMGTPEQHVVSYAYSPTTGQLVSITSDKSGVFAYGYDTLGRRATLSYPNGITGTYSYNSDRPEWLSGISYQGTLPVYSVSYPAFDKIGNRTAKNEGTLVSYGYDAVYRLLYSTAGETFTYDNAGNRLSDAAKLYSITAGNVLASAGATTFSYDSYGNTTGDGTWTYSWNNFGQMTQATKSGTTVSFKYDALGRRIEKAVNNGTESTVYNYLYDGQNIVAEFVNGSLVTHYLHGTGVDEHLALVRSGSSYFYHTDGLGSTAKITDSAQNVVQFYGYASFGLTTMATAFVQPFLYTGREYDPETGLNYHRARYLNMDTGRWLSKDPIGFAGGDVVLSNYVQNNPINWIDPNGLSKEHGRWCGGNWTGGKKEQYSADHDVPGYYADPEDPLDIACQVHDKCYYKCRNDFPCDKEARGQCFLVCDGVLDDAALTVGGWDGNKISAAMRRTGNRIEPNSCSCGGILGEGH